MRHQDKIGLVILCIPIAVLAALLCLRQYQSMTAERNFRKTLQHFDHEIDKAGFEKGKDGSWSILRPELKTTTNRPSLMATNRERADGKK